MGMLPCVRVVFAANDSVAESRGEYFQDRAQVLLESALAERAGEKTKIRSGSPLGIFLDAALAMQQAWRCQVGWASARALGNGRYEAAFECWRGNAANYIVAFAYGLVGTALGIRRENLVRLAERAGNMLANRASRIVLHDRMVTAARLGIQTDVDSAATRYLNWLGAGNAAEVSAPGYSVATSRLGKELCGDKRLTYRHLAGRDLPLASQLPADSEDEAVAAAETIGYPVVIKPAGANQGRGVSVNLHDSQAVRGAYRTAAEIQNNVVVERYLAGDDYRLLVIGGQFVAALRRSTPSVVGDGRHTLEELLELANRSERRDGTVLDPLELDEETLRMLDEQGINGSQVIAEGQRVCLRHHASPLSLPQDVTNLVHPDNRAMAVEAAQACFLDMAGVDVMSTDISVSWRDNGAGIVEVNAGPGIDMHLFPSGGEPQAVNRAFLRARFPAEKPGRPPVLMVTGRHGKRALTRWLANMLALSGCNAAIVDGEHHAAIHLPALNDAAVVDMSLKTLALEGMSLDRVNLAVITDDDPPINQIGKMLGVVDLAPRLHKLAVDVACERVVVDGTLAALRAAASHRPAWQVGYVWDTLEQPDTAALDTHLAAGGWAVCAEMPGTNGSLSLVYRSHQGAVPLGDLAELFPRSEEGTHRELLFACAALIGMGYSAEELGRLAQVAAYRPARQASLLVYGTATPWLATVDYRDSTGLRRLRRLLEQDGGQPCLLLLGEVRAEQFVENCLNILDRTGPLWCVIGEQGGVVGELARLGVPAGRCLKFPDLATARAALAGLARPQVLLSADAVQRCRPWEAVQSVPKRRPDSRHWTGLWLAECFRGTWVSGAPAEHQSARISCGIGEDTVGAIVVFDGDARKADTSELENRVRRAFAAGATAVVAPVAPPELPRWHPILVCDQPREGLLRLAQAARRQICAPQVVLAGFTDGLGGTLAERWRTFPNTPQNIAIHRIAGDDALIACAVTLTGHSPVSEASLFASDDVSALLLLAPDLLILRASEVGDEISALLDVLPADARVIAVVPGEHFHAWNKRLVTRNTPLFTLLDATEQGENDVFLADNLAGVVYAMFAKTKESL